MLVSTIDYSPYLGRLGIGRIERGTVRVGDHGRAAAARAGRRNRQSRAGARVTKLYGFEGLERIEVQEAVGRRDRRAGRARGRRDRPDGHRRRAPGSARGHRGRGADDLGRLHREQLALRRQGREVRDLAAGARASLPGARAQRRAARRGHRRDRHVDGVRTRRAASLDPDGDDASRGVRVPGVAAARDHARGTRTASGSSRTRSWRSTCPRSTSAP